MYSDFRKKKINNNLKIILLIIIMCGIWIYIKLSKTQIEYQNTLLYDNFMKLKHRGPDTTVFYQLNNLYIGFHRLAIINLNLMACQPYIFEDNNRTIIFICNGEIYNYKDLMKKYNIINNNDSDCMVICKLYIKYDLKQFIDIISTSVKGEYAFVLIELDQYKNIKEIISCRDEIGIRPLYYSYDDDIIFSSEIKGCKYYNENIYEFEPGTLLHIKFNNLKNIIHKQQYNLKSIYDIPSYINTTEKYLFNIQNSVINSIKRRLTSDKPIVFLLSGGVDSSLVAAISAKILNYSIRTFCCGLKDGTDILYARQVAKYINSNHTEVYFTEEEGLALIDEVIYTTETWDTTTIRASIGQYIVSKYISINTDAKVVLVGEGPDEVCSSYLLNYLAPSDNELHETAKEYVSKIHLFDGRRADRCISHFGMEARIPLLDSEFITSYWRIPAQYRHPKYKNIEKWWLRQAFAESNILPNEVLWRKKEAFSDGISSNNKSWYQIIQDHIKTKISDNDVKPSQEAFYYKQKFIEYFGENRLNIIPHYWQPKWINKDNDYIDPSARILDLYDI